MSGGVLTWGTWLADALLAGEEPEGSPVKEAEAAIAVAAERRGHDAPGGHETSGVRRRGEVSG